jgi:type II secretory pathway pseudopilin PulG
MSPHRRNSPGIAWRAHAFTLLETLLVLLIVGLGAGLILAQAGRLQQRRACDDYVRDLRTFSAAVAGYYQRHQTWPPALTGDSILPPEIEEALKGTNWARGSPFGGNYGWVAPVGAAGSGPEPGWGGLGAVTLTAFSPRFPLTLDRDDLLYIDRQIDDGNLATGRFRTGFNGWPVFLVEAAPR